MTSPFRPVLLLITMAAVMTATLSSAAGQGGQAAQEGALCAFEVRPGNLTISPAGGSIATSVSAQDGCAWSATVNVTWITVTSGARGKGDGAAMFSVAANTGPLRSANITVAGQTFPVAQDASGSVSSESWRWRRQGYREEFASEVIRRR